VSGMDSDALNQLASDILDALDNGPAHVNNRWTNIRWALNAIAATSGQRVCVDRDDLRRLMGLLHDLPNYAVDEDDDEALDRLRAALIATAPASDPDVKES
jgi:hypothetical protein